MGTSFQTQSRQRKLTYAALILVLFTATLFYRPWLLERHANRLELREVNQGEVDLAAVTARLALDLLGSRGFTQCVLWYRADQAKQKHEWNKLELLVRSITQLEPHFITPWLFQSWNLAYNVAAESDRVRDKYFYMSRGIELLAEGERHNRNHPDICFHIGYFYLDRIGQADQARTLRSLFQLSCIDPLDRDPARFRTADGTINLTEFEKFCTAYPHLVRRLREQQNCRTPEEVIDFLAENREVPTRYEVLPASEFVQARSRLKSPEQQFPVLPRLDGLDRTKYEHSPEDAVFPSDFDNNSAAQMWFIYAQESLPPAQREPGPSVPEFDRARYRLPRAPDLMIYRGYPAMAASRRAERLQREGWFDRGWEIDGDQRTLNRWFPTRLVVGDYPLSTTAWTKARDRWEAHGAQNGLRLAAADLDALQRQARLYRETFGVEPQQLDRRLVPDDFDGDMRPSFEAHRQLYWYNENRRKTRFPYFLAQAQAEADKDAIVARDFIYQAQRKRRAAEPAEGVAPLLEQAVTHWKRVFLRHPEYRADLRVQEYMYRLQYRHLEMQQERSGPQARAWYLLQSRLERKKVDLKQLCLACTVVTQAGMPRLLPAPWLPPAHLLTPGPLLAQPRAPFDERGPDGQPWISQPAIDRAHNRPDFEELN